MTDLERFLPLQEPTFYILLSLRGGEKHGYAILREVSELSGERLKLSTGTLYGALNRLLDQGLIERIDANDGPRGKKAYRLTRLGLEVFDADLARMRRLLLEAGGLGHLAGDPRHPAARPGAKGGQLI